MGKRLIVKNKWACKIFFLPQVTEAECSYILFQKEYWLEEDIELKFISNGDNWLLCSTDAYSIKNDASEEVEKALLLSKLEYSIETSDGEVVDIRVEDSSSAIAPGKKIDLRPMHRIIISSSEQADIVLKDEEHKDIVCRIRRVWNGWDIRSEGEGIVYLNGRSFHDRRPLNFGDSLLFKGFLGIFLKDDFVIYCDPKNVEFSDSITLKEKREEVELTTTKSEIVEIKEKLYKPSARILPDLYVESVEIENLSAESNDDEKTIPQIIGQSVLMVAPMMIGSVFIIFASKMSGISSSAMMYASGVMALASAVGSSAMAYINIKQQAERKKKNQQHRFKAYTEYIQTKVFDIRTKYEHNLKALREIYPHSKECLKYNKVLGNLFTCAPKQKNFLNVRIGIGASPSLVKVESPKEKFSLYSDEFTSIPSYIKENYSVMYDVPILLDIRAHSMIGIVGGEDKKGANDLARIISLQIAANCSFFDVKLVYIYDDRNSTNYQEWEFARFLPHVFSTDRRYRMVATNEKEISEVSYELSEIFRMREEKLKSDTGHKEEVDLPYYVIFVSDLSLIDGQLLSHYIYNPTPGMGITTFVLAEDYLGLPSSCDYVLENSPMYQEIIETEDSTQCKTHVDYDYVDKQDLLQFARDICGIQIAEDSREAGTIPSAISFLDMYKAREIKDLGIEHRWQKNKVYESMQALVGVGAGNIPIYLNVHEKYHGPHGLIAGTTGSGKSETLQTFLLSLAVEYSPDDVEYFIIDYKGGGMANLFSNLPHLTGAISNLSGSQVHRAMVAIRSENRRRQQLFNEAGVNNINKYSKLYKSGKVATPIPHLLIIIDEFAELKREEPDFMKELISVAQVGRSLGVHLILSTQKPSGTVDDNIWSNSKFRLCLAVQTKEDSHDMLGKSDAAYITQVGRCYLQVGNDELYLLFQSGYSGSTYDPLNSERRDASRWINITGTEEIVAGVSNGIEKKHTEEITQLDAVIDYIAKYTKKADFAPVHKLWLPVLKSMITLDEVEGFEATCVKEGGYNTKFENFELKAHVGIVDDPANQAQRALEIDFVNGGHHGIIGLTQTGKSTLMQTIIYSLINRYSPEYLNVYCLDFSSRALGAFENAAHVGGIIYEEDEEKIGRFFYLISKILKERKKEFRGGNFTQYYKSNGLKYPAIVVAIDNFGSFDSKTASKYIEQVVTLAKEGEANGIYLLISGANYSMTEIPSKVAGNIKSCLCLALKDKYSYADYLKVSRIEVLPEGGVTGRGLCMYEGRVLEYQVAVANDKPDDYSRLQSISNRVEELNAYSSSVFAEPIPEIPKNPTYNDFMKNKQTQQAINTSRLIPVGYDITTAEIYSISLATMYTYLIAGNRKSDKTNFERLLLNIWSQMDCEMVYIGNDKFWTSDSVIEKLQILDNQEAVYKYFDEKLTNRYKERKLYRKKLLSSGHSEEDVYLKMSEKYSPVFILIRDVGEFIEMIRGNAYEIEDYLKYIFQKGKDNLIYFFAGITLSDRSGYMSVGWFQEYIKEQSGIHLGGNISDDNYLNFRYLNYNEQHGNKPNGIGYISESINEPLKTKQVVIPSFYTKNLNEVEE